MKFSELGLKEGLARSLANMGFEDLTPIQEATFLVIRKGKDLIALAETGSGKTAAASIPIVESVDSAHNSVQSLVLVPTRELALQYVSEIGDIGRKTNVQPFAVYGGVDMNIQKGKLEHGVHVLVATPGRLIDLLYNTSLSLSEVSTLVIDEADHMMDMGFISDMEFVFSCLVHEHQTLLFSATMSKEIKELSKKYMRDPEVVELNLDQVAPESLEHHFKMVKGRQKKQELLDYIDKEHIEQAIIFCNSRGSSSRIYEDIKKKLDSVELIHGGMEQSKRTSLFNRFRKKKIRYLVATDVAGRGLDFSHVTHIINYDFPSNKDSYTHRTGRTARMGNEGVAITFVTPGNFRLLKRIIRENHVKAVWVGNEPDLNKSCGNLGGRGRGKGKSRGRGKGSSRGGSKSRGRRNSGGKGGSGRS